MSNRVRMLITGLAAMTLLLLFTVGAATQTPNPPPRQTSGPPPGWTPPRVAPRGPQQPGTAPSAAPDAGKPTRAAPAGKTKGERSGESQPTNATSPYDDGYARGYDDGYRRGFDAGYVWALYYGRVQQPGGYYFYRRGLYNGLPGPGSRPPAGPNGLYIGPWGMQPAY